MFRKWLLAAAAAAVLAQAAIAADALNVVATTTDLASIAREVAGERAKVRSITTGKEDPHYLQAKPSFIVMARDADLWISVGMDLEIGWEPQVVDGARNAAIRFGGARHVDASVRVLRLGQPVSTISRALGDVHPQGNPHYWLDPWNGRVVAETIAARLTEIDPAGADGYKANLESFRKRIDEAMFGATLAARIGGDRLWSAELEGRLDSLLSVENAAGDLGGWAAKMRPLRGKPIVIYHQSWNYFADRFDLPIAAEMEPKPGVPPSARHLSEVVEAAKAAGARIVLQEPFYERKSGEFVASKTGASQVVAANSVGGEKAASDYIAMISNVVDKVSAAAGK